MSEQRSLLDLALVSSNRGAGLTFQVKITNVRTWTKKYMWDNKPRETLYVSAHVVGGSESDYAEAEAKLDKGMSKTKLEELKKSFSGDKCWTMSKVALVDKDQKHSPLH